MRREKRKGKIKTNNRNNNNSSNQHKKQLTAPPTNPGRLKACPCMQLVSSSILSIQREACGDHLCFRNLWKTKIPSTRTQRLYMNRQREIEPDYLHTYVSIHIYLPLYIYMDVCFDEQEYTPTFSPVGEKKAVCFIQR